MANGYLMTIKFELSGSKDQLVVEIEVISRGVAYHNVYLNCPDVNSEDT